jgi:cytochrome c
MNCRKASAIGALLLAGAVSASAAPVRYGTEAQARALVAKAVQLFQKDGPSALAAIGKAGGPFFERDLYVFVIGPDKKIAADPAEPGLVGSEIATLRDPRGKPYALMIASQATEDGVEVDYEAKNPQTHRVEDKIAIAMRSGAYVFACGYYLPPPEAARSATAQSAVKSGGEKWTGRWAATDEEGAAFTITLDASGGAESDHGEGQRGFWVLDQDHLRIDWTDGWTDYFVPADGGFQRISFSPGAPRDEKPTSTTAITRKTDASGEK